MMMMIMIIIIIIMDILLTHLYADRKIFKHKATD